MPPLPSSVVAFVAAVGVAREEVEEEGMVVEVALAVEVEVVETVEDGLMEVEMTGVVIGVEMVEAIAGGMVETNLKFNAKKNKLM